MLPGHGAVIGVDVGCSPVRRSSAICLLRWTQESVDWRITRFRAIEPKREAAIAAMAQDVDVLAAAFDGSLRRGFDLIGHYRSAERMLTRRLGKVIGKPGQSSTPVGKLLNEHANVCVGHVLAHAQVGKAQHGIAIDESAVVEAFPSAFLGLLIADPTALAAKRGDRSDKFFVHLADTGTLDALLTRCLPGRTWASDLRQITNHDDRAAFVCALTALCVAKGEFCAVGDPVDGWIILPPPALIAPAHWHMLEQNAADETTGALHIAS